MKQHFQYSSEIQEIPDMRIDLRKLESEWAIPDSEMRQIVVIIEELFSNIVRFAYEDNHKHLIDISLEKKGEEISISIIDDGIPFNPLEYNPGPVSDPVGSEDGGMGITLIRAFSNSISYERVNQRNHLKITKKIKSNSSSC